MSGNLKRKNDTGFKLKFLPCAVTYNNRQTDGSGVQCFKEASVPLAKSRTWLSQDDTSEEGTQRGGRSRHFPKKNQNWKTGYVTTDSRVMLLPVALSESKWNRWSTMNRSYSRLMYQPISVILVILICGFVSRGLISIYAFYTGVRLVCLYIYIYLNCEAWRSIHMYDGDRLRD